MPTKPISTFQLATNTLYSAGPFAGSATRVVPADLPNGFIPGQGVQAEPLNYTIGIAGDWITDWLALGSSSPGLTAHLVETDATGVAELAGLSLGGTASDQRALLVDANSGSASSAVIISNSFGGYCLLATAIGSTAAMRLLALSSGAALDLQSLGSASALTATASGTGATIAATATGSGSPITATSNGTAAAGVFTGPTAAATAAVTAVARHVNAYGLETTTAASAGLTATGARCVGLGLGSGLQAVASGTGYGAIVQADTTSPERAPLRIVPQDADPSSGAAGDITYSSTLDQPRVYADGWWQAPWTTTKGHCHAVSYVTPGPIYNADSGSWTDLSTATLASPNEPKTAGVILLYAAADFGDEVGVSHHSTIDVRIYDVTSTAVVWSATIANIDRGASAALLCPRGWSVITPYVTPAAGVREFRLQYKRTVDVDPTDGLVARNTCLDVLGVFGV